MSPALRRFAAPGRKLLRGSGYILISLGLAADPSGRWQGFWPPWCWPSFYSCRVLITVRPGECQ